MSRMLATGALSAALGLVLAAQGGALRAADMPQVVKDNMMKMQNEHLIKCYGVNAVGKNDCAEGAHSCAGMSTQARDSKSFVLLPTGVCAKIEGGRTTSS